MRTARSADLPVNIDRSLAEPLPQQLAAELRRLIGREVLRPGEAVPATRALADRLGLARGSVVAAYEQLLAEGYLVAERGGATRVNPSLGALHPQGGTAKAATRPPATALSPAAGIDLLPGRPSVDRIATPTWRAAWREAAARPFDPEHDEFGLFRLRDEIASHLRLMRGVLRDPRQIVVTSGGREGLTLLLTALGPAGLRIGVEDPGYPSLRRVLTRLGLQVVPLAADRNGLVVSELPVGEEAPDAVIVTPSHQYPLGGSLPVDRRLGLLAWARKNGVWVVEDDYDSELRYSSQPLPALGALDQETDARVVTLGTFATTLGPGLGAGYLAVPDTLVQAVRDVRLDLGQPVSLVVQQALAAYLGAGELRRHTQRMRHLYRRRRDLVVQAFAGVETARVYPMDGGLHAVVETLRDEQVVLADAEARGVLVAGLSRYWSATEDRPSGDRPRGIVFGFGGVSEAELAAGLRILTEVCSGTR